MSDDGFTAVTKKKGKGKTTPREPQYLFIDEVRVAREWPPSMRHNIAAAPENRGNVDFGGLASVAEEAGLTEMVAIPNAAQGAGTGNFGAKRLRLLVVEGWGARKHRDIWKLRAFVKNFLNVPAELLPRIAAHADAPAPLNTHYVILSSAVARSSLTGQVIDKHNNIHVVRTPGHVPEFDDTSVMWEACEAAEPYLESVGGFQLFALRWYGDPAGALQCHAEPATLAQVGPTHYPAVMQGYVDVVSGMFAQLG